MSVNAVTVRIEPMEMQVIVLKLILRGEASCHS